MDRKTLQSFRDKEQEIMEVDLKVSVYLIKLHYLLISVN